jgi:hypothetical protein
VNLSGPVTPIRGVVVHSRPASETASFGSLRSRTPLFCGSFTYDFDSFPSPAPLPLEEYEALKNHIARNGVQQPILITSWEIIINGNHVFRAVTELGIRNYPVRVVSNLSEMERREMAISLNLLRRHFTPSERRHWLEELVRLNPHQSNRDLASAARVSQSTAARTKAKVLGIESNDSVEMVGRVIAP